MFRKTPEKATNHCSDCSDRLVRACGRIDIKSSLQSMLAACLLSSGTPCINKYNICQCTIEHTGFRTQDTIKLQERNGALKWSSTQHWLSFHQLHDIFNEIALTNALNIHKDNGHHRRPHC